MAGCIESRPEIKKIVRSHDEACLTALFFLFLFLLDCEVKFQFKKGSFFLLSLSKLSKCDETVKT